MNKAKCFLLISMMIIITSGCVKNTITKDKIIEKFNMNKTEYIKASQTGDFSLLKKLDEVESVYESDNYVKIDFKGSGLVSNSNYYGIYYSESDSLCAIDISPPCDELKKDGAGFRYKQENGDNEYYVEELGYHYFYYEAQF